MSTAAATAVPARSGFLQRSAPVGVILGSFAVVTLPLCALMASSPPAALRTQLEISYAVFFGMTHFVLTFTIYLQSANLRHFTSSWKTRVIYFAVPLVIFVFFDVYRLFPAMPLLDGAVFILFRSADFNHFARQNYGVLQVLKSRVGARFPPWQNKVENGAYFGVTLLLLSTALNGGHFDAHNPAVWTLLSLLGVAWAFVAWGFWRTWKAGALRGPLLSAAAYIVTQLIAAGLASWSIGLYVFCLATHYVEYHVMMVPRCFDAPLDPTRAVDRVFARLRQSKVAFYAVVLGLAALAEWCVRHATQGDFGPGSPAGYVMLISVFDGIFLAHYFLESFIWKFSVPYYREALGPLLLGAKQKPQPAVLAP